VKEKLQEYALIAEIIGGIGIVASLIFVGFQLQQNSETLKAQTRSEISQNITEFILAQVTSPYFAELQGLPSDDEERIARNRRNTFRTGQLRVWENIHYQYRKGLYEESEFSKEREVWRRGVNRQEMKRVYCNTKNTYSDEFVADLDSIMNEPCD
jgi:hypothetical protein